MPPLFQQAAPVAPPQVDITLFLAIAALVLAVVTLILDFAFFVLTWRGQVAFTREMNQRQDRLTERETELFVQMSTVLAQVSERARIVQEQVDKQMVRLTDYVMGGATITGAGISAEMQQAITKIEQQMATISPQTDAGTVAAVRHELNQLSSRVERLPEQLALSARESMNSIGDELAATSDESDADMRHWRVQGRVFVSDRYLRAGLRQAIHAQEPPESGSWVVRVGDLLRWAETQATPRIRSRIHALKAQSEASQQVRLRRELELLGAQGTVKGINSQSPELSDWTLLLPLPDGELKTESVEPES